MINENIAKGNWKEFKGKIQKAWGNLSEDELESSKGDLNSLSGMIQKKYGIAQEEARRKLNDLVAGFGDKEKRDKKLH
ncbi:MAG: CsbD family protein [Bdellovibrionota bacterium]